jgi:hypothetical protein
VLSGGHKTLLQQAEVLKIKKHSQKRSTVLVANIIRNTFAMDLAMVMVVVVMLVW